MTISTVRALTVSLAASAALLSSPAAAEKETSKKQADPNEVICEKAEVLGSRLVSKRICATRAEWAEKRRIERMELDKTQTQKALDGR